MILHTLFLSLLLIIQITTTPPKSGTISMKFLGIEQKHVKGYIKVSLFNNEKGFPTTKQSVIKTYQIKVSSTHPSFEIEGLPYGQYAISCFLDENDNNQLDTNFFGIPKEKVGTSNNPSSGGIPNYDDAKFTLNQPQINISIEMK